MLSCSSPEDLRLAYNSVFLVFRHAGKEFPREVARDQCASVTPPVIVDFDSTIIFPSHRVLLYPERTSAAFHFYFQGFGGMLVLVGLLLPRKKGFFF